MGQGSEASAKPPTRVTAGVAPTTPEAKANLQRVLAGVRSAEGREEDDGEDEGAASEPEAPDSAPEEVAAEEKDEKPLVGIPDWFTMPPGVKIESGTPVFFFRVPPKFTLHPRGPAPWGRERQCLLALLTVHEEKLAYQRAAVTSKGVAQATIDELSMQTIKVIDGKRADWSQRASDASVPKFWKGLGRLRARVRDWYLLNHTMTQVEQTDFLANYAEARIWGE